MADRREFVEGDGLIVPAWASPLVSIEVGGPTILIECPNSEDTSWRDVPDRPTSQQGAEGEEGGTKPVPDMRPAGTDGPAAAGSANPRPEEPEREDPRREGPVGPAAGTQRSQEQDSHPPQQQPPQQGEPES